MVPFTDLMIMFPQEESNVYRYVILAMAMACMVVPVAAETTAGEPAARAETFTLWQLPNQTHTQMMSYVIQTPDGSLLVIDGGNKGDAPYLREFIEARGGKVAAWIITHVHSDHVDALGEILKEPGAVAIGTLYGSVPERDWVAAHCAEAELATYDAFMAALARGNREVSELSLGQELKFGSITIRVLGIKNPEITVNPINNSSIAFRLWDAHKSVLFTADLGPQGGQKLLESEYAQFLPSDYVQMAHHGQRGVTEAFYQAVNPSYCLWPTPLWLWDNDKGEGKGSGSWETLEVRAWMDKLPIKRHYCMHEGLQEIR